MRLFHAGEGGMEEQPGVFARMLTGLWSPCREVIVPVGNACQGTQVAAIFINQVNMEQRAVLPVGINGRKGISAAV